MPIALIHQLTVPAQANVRSTLRAQPGRSQNRTLSLMNLDRMTIGAGGGVFDSGITPAARALACTENVLSSCAMEAIDG